MPLLTATHLELARQNGLKPKTVMNRVYNLLWEVDRAITEPIIEPHIQWKDWKEKSVVPKVTFFQRIGRGMTPEEAASTPPKRRNRKRA